MSIDLQPLETFALSSRAGRLALLGSDSSEKSLGGRIRLAQLALMEERQRQKEKYEKKKKDANAGGGVAGTAAVAALALQQQNQSAQHYYAAVDQQTLAKLVEEEQILIQQMKQSDWRYNQAAQSKQIHTRSTDTYTYNKIRNNSNHQIIESLKQSSDL